MESREKFLYWNEIASYDLETADAMLNTGRYLYVAFMCQQAIEKLVKGIFVFHYGEEAARTHNIWNILKPLIDDEKFNKETEDYLNQNKIFFADLAFYYISERYPSYKENLSNRLNKDSSTKLLLTTKEVFKCLVSQCK